MPTHDRVPGIASSVFLVLAGLVLAYAVVFSGYPVAQAHGAMREQQLTVLLVVAVLGILYSLFGRPPAGPAPVLPRGLPWLLFLLPAYILLQVVPLPLNLLRVLSPQRAADLEALGQVMPKPDWAPLAVTPSETLFHLWLFLACLALFLIVYRLSWQFASRPWFMVLPLLAIAAGEAALGLAQAAGGAGAVATGTYSIRNHFAGLLEMVLPFAALGPVAALKEPKKMAGVGPVLIACAGWGLTLLLLVGVASSLSRMGFLSALGSLVFVAAIAWGRGRSWSAAGLGLAGVAVAGILAFVLLAPAGLILRYGDVNQEDRAEVWKEALPMVAAYPLFGCGLGGFESAFVRFKASGPGFTEDYAHNDYLQYLGELGVVGFALAAWPAVVILWRLGRTWLRVEGSAWWLSLACAGSAFAIGVHSFVDFNLYVPANMLVFAWIMGLAASCGAAFSSPASATPGRSKRYR